jgi:hypothetical protein
MFIDSMFHINLIIGRIINRTLLIIMIVLFFTVCLIPVSQGTSNPENDIEIEKNQTIKNFDRCIFFIYGEISNPRIEEQGSRKYLYFDAKKVHIIGVSYGYDGPVSITQWIYSEVVKISWKTSGPNFRGLVTNNYLLGTQRYRYF